MRATARPTMRAAALALGVVLALSGCGAGDPASGLSAGGTSPAVAITTARGSSLVAAAQGASLTIRDDAGGAVVKELANPGPAGSALTLLVLRRTPGWVQVSLPGRPNGSSGWVRQADVQLAVTPWRLVVHESAYRLDVFTNGRRVAQYPVGVGRAATPTVHGTFFVTELIRPPDPDGVYGPYAFGLSAYSEVLTSFAGGSGQLGLHGTDQPTLVGTDVSHGCLRVTNAVITRLAGQIPLGTPIEIRA